MKIVICGNIGCGKSTLIRAINDNIRVPIFLEPLHKWQNLMTLFYQDPNKYAFSFNLEVLTSFHEWKNNKFPAIYERCPLCCRHVFTQINHEDGHIHPYEMEVFDRIFKELSWTPDVIIYIRTDPDICSERMQRRGRDCEKSVPLDYLQKIHDKYESLIECLSSVNMHDTNPPKIHVIEGNKTEKEVYYDAMNALSNYLE